MNCIPPKKSSTCFSMRGTPLSVFDTFNEAQSIANYENRHNPGYDLAPYRCLKCGKFHLKPSGSIVIKLLSRCSCTSSGGRHKDAYASRAEAKKMATIRTLATGIQLYEYQCPEGNGWHLTSHPHN